MKKKIRKEALSKGTPSAVLVSILIHGALFFLAGMLVVFTVVNSKEVEFEPPRPTERPKMKLKKPKVKIKQSSKPKSTTRIVTMVNRTSIPDIQLPEMTGIGDDLGGDFGGFDLMPNLEDGNIFGSGQSIGNDLEGTFYDFKRDRQGRPILMNSDALPDTLRRFVQRGWDTSVINKFYRSPKKLYATCVMIPTTLSMLGPRSFGEETGGWCWMVHYKGSLVYPEDVRFRFWGYGDDLLMVRVNGTLVLNGNFHNEGAVTEISAIGGGWDSSAAEDAQYWYGTNKARVGDWIELKAGQAYNMEILIGEIPGGTFSAMLTVQVDGEEYKTNRQCGPILPMFMTAEPSRALQDSMLSTLIEGEACVTNGPVFRDYKIAKAAAGEETGALDDTPVTRMDELKKTEWKCLDDTIIEGDYVTAVVGCVILKSPAGRQLKVPISALAQEDREYLELEYPPAFKIEFRKLVNNASNRYKQSPKEMSWGYQLPRVNDYTFGAKVKQVGIQPYNHELTVEYFAIGKEMLGDKYILLDRQARTFTLGKENDRSFAFTGEVIEFLEYIIDGQMRGQRPCDSIVILKDKRGNILEYNASKSWLWDNLDKLNKLPVGAYIDRQCNRTYPTSPKPTNW